MVEQCSFGDIKINLCFSLSSVIGRPILEEIAKE
jgi:hypothetical protein